MHLPVPLPDTVGHRPPPLWGQCPHPSPLGQGVWEGRCPTEGNITSRGEIKVSLAQKLQCYFTEDTHRPCVCVCVCVCERERGGKGVRAIP